MTVHLAVAKHFPNPHVSPRMYAAVELTAGTAARVADIALGVLAGACAIATLGLSWHINATAWSQLKSARLLLPAIYRSALLMINPKARAFTNTSSQKPSVIPPCLRSENPLIKHLFLRLYYPMHFAIMTMIYAVELAIGLIVATFSLLTAGRFTRCNTMALRNLNAGALIFLLVHDAVHCINPWASISIQS